MTDDASSSSKGGWTAALAAAGAALFVYLVVGRVTSFETVNFDDARLLSRENPAIGKGLVAGLPDLLDPTRRPQFMNAWLPLQYWSVGLDHALGGGAAWAFHMHSALLHALAAALVALVARRLGATSFVAGLAGVIFAVHPVATESVAWIAGRKAPLSFVWMALAALCYLEAIAKRRASLHALGAACLLVSMTANGTTLVLPLLLVVHAVLLRPANAPRAERLAAVVPYALVAAAMTGVHLWAALREGAAKAATGDVLLADLSVACHYVVALFAPLRQSVEHDVANDAKEWFFLGGAALVVWAVALAAAWKRSRAVAAALLAVALALAPFNNVFPRTTVLFAERYAYVALLPAAIAIAWCLRPRGDGVGSLLPAAVGVGALATLCAMRLPVWHDSVALWEDAACKAPRSALVQLKLADAYTDRARRPAGADVADAWARAGNAWLSAIELAKSGSSALDGARAEQGMATHLYVENSDGRDAAGLRAAVAHFDAAETLLARLDDRGAAATRAEALSNRGACKELLGDNAGATADYEKAVRLDESCAPAWNGLARRHLAAGRGNEARDALAKSEKAAPHDPTIVRDRARIRLAAGDAGGAKRDLAEAIEANPTDVELIVEAARLDAMWLRPVDAETKLRRALALRPGDEPIRELLAAALLDQAQAQASRDDMPAAREAARKAGEVAPQSSAPEQLLGIVARRAGNLEEAAQHLRRARELQPQGVRIREQLASVLVERAAALLDETREGVALLLLEEAVETRAAALATPKARLEVGVDDWPPPAKDDVRATVARDAALKALAWLAVARPVEALAEATVAESGTKDGDARMRRVALRLLVAARFASGRFDDAVAAAQALPSIEIPEDAAWAWRRHAELGAALVERGTSRRTAGDAAGATADFAAARAAFERARSAGMAESKFRTRVGEILFREQDFLAATKEFDQAEEASKDDVEPLIDRARVWLTQFLLEEDKAYLVAAQRDFRRAMEIAPNDPRVLAGLGETLVLGQKQTEAFPLLTKAVLADPSQIAARRMLADLAVRAGKSRLEKIAGRPAAQIQTELADARSVAERAVALDAPSPEALVFLGDVLRAQGDWTAALAKYELARARFPESTPPLDAIAKHHMDRGHMLLLVKKRAEALTAFRAAVETPRTTIDLAPAKERLHEIAVVAFGEAMDLDKEGKFAEAAERFALSLAAEPTAEGHVDRGVALGKASRLEESAEAFAAALAMDPKRLDARLNRAGTLRRLGRLDEAESDYRAWLDAAPADDPSRRRVLKQIEQIEADRREIEKETPK